MGSIPDFTEAPISSLSPDGSMLAFQLRRADPSTNSYCLGMFVIEMRAGATPRMLDQGGALIRWTSDSLGKADFPSGFPKVITPRWSSDGRWIAFLKRTGAVTQVWRANIAGDGGVPITTSEDDVNDFRIGPDDKTIYYASQPALRTARNQIVREGLSGYHFDERFSPVASSVPFPPSPIPVQVFAMDIASGRLRSATASESAELLQPKPPNAPNDAIAFARSPSGRRAWTRSKSLSAFPPAQQLVADDQTGQQAVACTNIVCADVDGAPWWTLDGQRVRFIKREGWGQSVTAIYEWRPGRNAPRRLYSTDDLLIDCKPLHDNLLCARETSTRPRHLAEINLASRKVRILFDPNPEFSERALGRVERMHWKNAFDIETFGDVVYPVGYRRGARYPLVIVQYSSRGFLRGGTGDEYPIQAFANRGYAVLSFQRPRSTGLTEGVKDYADVDKSNLIEFKNRRSVLSSIELAVQTLIERGLVDPRRVGITGLSDGASTVQFAALNSSMFAAAAMSSCCWEQSQAAILGPTIARIYGKAGWPTITQEAPSFWSRISLAQNARRVRFPILMQLSDDEYAAALESYTALKEVGAPADLFIFPNEFHVKWQPAHRLAAYERSLDWFDFWLRGMAPTSSERRVESTRWEEMKTQGQTQSRR